MDSFKEKKTRDVGFENVKDPNVKTELMALSKSPLDATNFIFWYSKVEVGEWGLTLKSIPKKSDKEGFPSQHTWKITWFFKNGDDGPKLAVANHCRSLAADITGDDLNRVTDIYKNYRK